MGLVRGRRLLMLVVVMLVLQMFPLGLVMVGFE